MQSKCMLGCNQISTKADTMLAVATHRKAWFCLGKKTLPVGGSIHKSGSHFCCYLWVGFQNNLETDSKASLETARELQESGRCPTLIQFYKTLEHLVKRRVARALFTSWAVYKNWVKACSLNKQWDQWTPADLSPS